MANTCIMGEVLLSYTNHEKYITDNNLTLRQIQCKWFTYLMVV